MQLKASSFCGRASNVPSAAIVLEHRRTYLIWHDNTLAPTSFEYQSCGFRVETSSMSSNTCRYETKQGCVFMHSDLRRSLNGSCCVSSFLCDAVTLGISTNESCSIISGLNASNHPNLLQRISSHRTISSTICSADCRNYTRGLKPWLIT